MNSHLHTPGSVPPLLAAPLFLAYPQFVEAPIPELSNAVRAWVGNIQPFGSDLDAQHFLLRVENRLPCAVDSGTLIVPATKGKHLFFDYLVGIVQTCRLLILEQPHPAHPRAYLLSPPYDLAMARSHPHARSDQIIVAGGKTLPGMCIYSAAEHKFDPSQDRLVQYLDLVTTHVARHLIWLKTRSLHRAKADGTLALIRPSRPGEVIPSTPARNDDVWIGYWPGPTAKAMGARGHLNHIAPADECWCGSSLMYKDCHRKAEIEEQKGARKWRSTSRG